MKGGEVIDVVQRQERMGLGCTGSALLSGAGSAAGLSSWSDRDHKAAVWQRTRERYKSIEEANRASKS